MKKLLFALCFLAAASLCSAQTVISGVVLNDQVTVTFSATPTFDASKANMFKLTLTGNVTSSALSNVFVGQQLGFEICQDATGGRTFVPPSNVGGWATIPGAANSCTLQFFWFDAAGTAQPLSISLLGGVTFPLGISAHEVPVGTASNVITYKTVPDCTDSAGNHINYTQSTDAFSCGTSVPATLTSENLVSPNSTGTDSGTENLGGKTIITPFQGLAVVDTITSPMVFSVHSLLNTATNSASFATANAVAGTYEVGGYVYVSTAGTSGSLGLSFAYNNGAAQAINSATNANLGTLGSNATIPTQIIQIAANTTFGWGASVTSGVGAFKYDVHLIVRRIK